MTSPGSKSRIAWEGDSRDEIRSWPDDVRQDFGLELHRLDNHEDALDSRPMAPRLAGVSELRSEDRSFWYRLLYWPHSERIYVLHCFKKKTNETSDGDIAKAKDRMQEVRRRESIAAKNKKKGA